MDQQTQNPPMDPQINELNKQKLDIRDAQIKELTKANKQLTERLQTMLKKPLLDSGLYSEEELSKYSPEQLEAIVEFRGKLGAGNTTVPRNPNPKDPNSRPKGKVGGIDPRTGEYY